MTYIEQLESLGFEKRNDPDAWMLWKGKYECYEKWPLMYYVFADDNTEFRIVGHILNELPNYNELYTLIRLCCPK